MKMKYILGCILLLFPPAGLTTASDQPIPLEFQLGAGLSVGAGMNPTAVSAGIPSNYLGFAPIKMGLFLDEMVASNDLYSILEPNLGPQLSICAKDNPSAFVSEYPQHLILNIT